MIAHIRETDKREQSVKEHCVHTSMLCAEYATSIGAEHIGKIQGILHDIGKMTTKFEKYIRNETKLRRGEIDHSYAGAKVISEMAKRFEDEYAQDVSCLIAHTILSHHGVHDWLDQNENDYLADRIQKEEDYDEVLSRLPDIISEIELIDLLNIAVEEYKNLNRRIKNLSKRDKCSYAFYKGMLERFLLSCLVDADRSDTADFMSDACLEKRCDTQHLWHEMSVRMQTKCDIFAKRTDSFSRLRCSISDRCEEFSRHPVGVCRLVVPTGGGKTLSSLRFAISYCCRYNKKKIIYTAPFMSILEQNSDEIRLIAGGNYFTEHHSNLLAEIDTTEELHEYELRTERWDSPVIATTLVQLLNTMFAAKK